MDMIARRSSIGIEVKVTNRCNQLCVFCMNDDSSRSTGELHASRFLERLDAWAGDSDPALPRPKEVRMTGGEPLLRVGVVEAIADLCQRRGILSGINSNGLLLKRSVAERLKAVGLGVVKISLDSVDTALFRSIRGSKSIPADALRGMEIGVRAGFKVIARFTLTAQNKHQMIPCFEAARAVGVAKFQIKPIVPAGRATMSGAFLTRAQIDEKLAELATRRVADGTAIEVLCWEPERAGGLGCSVCKSINKLYVSPDLHVTKCNYVVDPESAGHLERDTFQQIAMAHVIHRMPTPHGHMMLAGCPQQAFLADAAPTRTRLVVLPPASGAEV